MSPRENRTPPVRDSTVGSSHTASTAEKPTPKRPTVSPSGTLAEARSVFEQTVVPRDLDLINLPFAERGMPRLVRGDGREPVATASPG